MKGSAFMVSILVGIAAPWWIALPWIVIVGLRAYADRPEIVFEARDAR